MGTGPEVSGPVRGIAAAAGLIAAVTIIARAAGFLRTLVFADSVRAAGVGEVYNAVNAVPNVLYEVAAGGALAAVAVPLVAGHLGAGRGAEADRVASALLTWAVTVLSPLAVLVWLVAGPVSGALVGESVAGGRETGAQMLRIFAWQIPLYGVGVVLAGVLQAHRRFLAAALAPLLSSLVVIGTYLAYGSIVQGRTTGVGDHAVALLAWGTTLGVVVLSLPLLLPVLRMGWRPRWTWRFPPGEAARARRLAGAGLLALGAQQLAVLVTIRISLERGGGQGTLSVQNWIQAVYLLPYAVLAVPLATAAFPVLASGTGRADDSGAGPDDATHGPSVAARTLSRTLRVLVLLTALGAAALVAAAPQIGAFFAHLDARRGGGAVSGSAVPALGDGLTAFAVGLPAFAAVALLTRALYVRGRALAGGAAVAAGWVISALGPLLTIGPGSTPRSVLVGLGAWWSAGMLVAAVAQGSLVVRAWGREAVMSVWPSIVASAVALYACWPFGRMLGKVLPVGDSIPATLALGLVAGLAGVCFQLALVTIGHRDSLRELDPRRLRAGGAR